MSGARKDGAEYEPCDNGNWPCSQTGLAKRWVSQSRMQMAGLATSRLSRTIPRLRFPKHLRKDFNPMGGVCTKAAQLDRLHDQCGSSPTRNIRIFGVSARLPVLAVGDDFKVSSVGVRSIDVLALPRV